jgi:hypothetical protein
LLPVVRANSRGSMRACSPSNSGQETLVHVSEQVTGHLPSSHP